MSTDLSTKYLGLALRNPIVASASPMTGTVDSLKRMEDAGIAAAVLPSLFEEQIEHEEMEVARMQDSVSDGYAEALDFFPLVRDYGVGPDSYLEHIRKSKAALGIPIIASLNGLSTGGWIRYAKLCQEAGCDALELNVYDVPTSHQATSEAVETRYLDLVRSIKESTSIPLAVKIGPYFSSIAHMAQRLKEAGADGLVLFNRFMFPDIDLVSMEVNPEIELSNAREVGLPTRWIAILKGRVDVSLAATSGIHTAKEVIKVMLAGADVTMMASALLKKGPAYPAEVIAHLQSWLAENEYRSIEQLKGSMSHENSPHPEQFERANYMKIFVSYSSMNS